MSLKTLTGKQGLLLHSTPFIAVASGAASASTLDAAGESLTSIGKVFLEGGSGSKTISSSGGSILWRSNTATFANAGTTLRLGIQDVAATGIEDTTFDVHADLVGGTDTLTSGPQNTAMESGSKTINHGDLIAISFELISRGGADTLQVQSPTLAVAPKSAYLFPYSTVDTGSGPIKTSGFRAFTIIFDDGTIGWISPFWQFPNWTVNSSTSYNSGSASDELAVVFKVPFKCSLNGFALAIGNIASTDDLELILYRDATGTPVAEQTVAIDADLTVAGAATTDAMQYVSITPTVLNPNVWYAISARPTTVNDISFFYVDMASDNTKFKRPSPFGEDMLVASRADQSGAFSTIQTYYYPLFYLSVDKLDDGGGFIIGG